MNLWSSVFLESVVFLLFTRPPAATSICMCAPGAIDLWRIPPAACAKLRRRALPWLGLSWILLAFYKDVECNKVLSARTISSFALNSSNSKHGVVFCVLLKVCIFTVYSLSGITVKIWCLNSSWSSDASLSDPQRYCSSSLSVSFRDNDFCSFL